jgi:hypothetical protein
LKSTRVSERRKAEISLLDGQKRAKVVSLESDLKRKNERKVPLE